MLFLKNTESLTFNTRPCAVQAIRGFMKAFGIGYTVKCSLSLFSAIFARKLYRKYVLLDLRENRVSSSFVREGRIAELE